MTGGAFPVDPTHPMRPPCHRNASAGRSAVCFEIRSRNSAATSVPATRGAPTLRPLPVSPRASSAPPPRHNGEPDRHERLGVVSRLSGWGSRVRGRFKRLHTPTNAIDMAVMALSRGERSRANAVGCSRARIRQNPGRNTVEAAPPSTRELAPMSHHMTYEEQQRP